MQPLLSFIQKSKRRFLTVVLILAASFLPYQLIAQEVATGQAGKTLVLGKISTSPHKHLKSLQSMADYLVSHMHDLGYSHGKVLLTPDKQGLARNLRQGKVDLITETAFSTMYLHEAAGAEPILRKWKKGIAEYHSVIFVRKDSGINNLDDLKGKTIAFEDSNSTSAYYLPAYELLMAGLQLEQLNSPRDKARANFIGYVFSKQEINTSVWVHKGRTDAGALSNIDWQKNDHMPESFHADLKIIHHSLPIPRALESLRNDLPNAVKARIKQLLLAMDKDPAAYQVLHDYQKTRKFDLLTGQTWQDLIDINQRLNIVDRATQ